MKTRSTSSRLIVPFTAVSLIALLSGAAPAATTLSPPVTVTYGGGADAVTVNISGTGRGIVANSTNNSNNVSAISGRSNGGGAGVNGVNQSNLGPAGKFEITSTTSAIPVITATTAGGGIGVLSTLTKANSNTAAIYGSNTATANYGTGVQGVGGRLGVWGYGQGSGTGVWGSSDNYIGVYGTSNNIALYGNNGSGSGYGAWGNSTYGYGVFGTSAYGYAAYFSGKARVTGNLTVGSLSYSSDRALKDGLAPVDGDALLDRIDQMPITSWHYKTDPQAQHIGPMAQDFHAAFGLGGNDETHIGAVDAAGVTLAAVQALHRQLKEKDARLDAQQAEIASLRANLAALDRAIDERVASLIQQQQQAQQTGPVASAR